MIPSSKVSAFFELLMQAIVNGNFVFASESDESFHVGDCVDGFESGLDVGIEFSFWVEEFVVGVD